MPQVVSMVMTDRQGVSDTVGYGWTKPVVLLVNERTTSGKEAFAFAFQKHRLGKVVGSQTAGALLAGSPSILSNGDILYLAVADVTIDGRRLEGVGVKPDVVVERPLPYAQGADPQLEKAFEIAIGQLKTP